MHNNRIHHQRILCTRRIFPIVTALFFSLVASLCTTKKAEEGAASQDKTSEILSARTLGLAYLEENKLEDARDQFLKLIDLAPDEALGYANLGLVYMRMGQLDEAEKQLKKAIELSPDDTDIRLNLVRVYEMANEKDKAAAELNKNEEIDPTDAKSLFALAEMHAGGQDENARAQRERYLGAIVKLKPTNLAARLYLVESLLRNNKPDEALETLEQIERIAPEMPEDASKYYTKAMDLIRSGDITQALTSVIILHNFLKLTNDYQTGMNVLKGEQGTTVGTPIITFNQVNTAFVPEGASILESMKYTDASQAAGIPVFDGISESDQELHAHITATDIDRDTDTDLYIGIMDPATGQYRSFMMQNEMGRFSDITRSSGIDHQDRETGAAFGDYNNDGFIDLYITQGRGSKLYFNKDVGAFVDRTQKAGASLTSGGNMTLFFDYDHDGDLDLFVAGDSRNTLLRNNADETFTEVSEQAGLRSQNLASSDACFADFDDDGDIDLFVASHAGENRLYTNLREGRFRDISAEALPSLPGEYSAVTCGDYNNDGFPDLCLASADLGGHILLRNQGDGTFVQDGQPVLAKDLKHIKGRDIHFFDFDNDGFLDLLLVGSTEDTIRSGVVLLHNDNEGNFTIMEDILPDHIRTASRIAVADYNLDGDLDIFLAGNQGVFLLRNDGSNANRHIKVQLVGVRTGSGKNNYYGIGSKVEMRSGNLYQMRTVTNQNVYFGMAQKEEADIVRILWPNGTAQNIFNPGSDQDLVEEQILKGSCPFLYTWNGEKFTFVKDVMWRSALGMPLGIMGANTTYAFADASRDYIKIDGTHLQAQDGQYTLQLTGELWETLYIDEVKLIAADHPDSISIFVNEAFSPPPFPGLDLYAIAGSFSPKTATNHKGNDVHAYIADKDDLYLSDFRHSDYQGITDTTSLILDPGTNQTDGLLLFLNGWIFPTDASINKAISQSSGHGVLFPRIEVLDENGIWKAVVEDLGFPMGKDKTIVVDLTDAYRSNGRLLRIRTNQEIYWDHIFFGYRLGDTGTDTSMLTLSGADLHYRGFSRMYRKGGRYGPHWFDYDQVETGQKWRDLSGVYTRYGDVTPLLTAPDNNYVIANAGDEVTMNFRTPGSVVPDGWKRDFFIYTVGWVKDGDMNTATGNTVEPLPYHGLEEYPYEHPSVFSLDETLKEYRRIYNTRRVTADEFRNAIRATSR
jgi:Tfp pilus assembly protein PilF